jgi:hypothetical protein
MTQWRALALAVLVSVGFACGQVGPTSRLSSSDALTGTAELLEFEPVTTRQDLFREVMRTAQQQVGLDDRSRGLLFLVHRDGAFVAAPVFDGRSDLLMPPDAGTPRQLTFDGRGERFGDDRREAFQGLSEREAAELIARSLLERWGVAPTTAVQVVRAPGAAYAAAYFDGVLRINPAFVYLASAPSAP